MLTVPSHFARHDFKLKRVQNPAHQTKLLIHTVNLFIRANASHLQFALTNVQIYPALLPAQSKIPLTIPPIKQHFTSNSLLQNQQTKNTPKVKQKLIAFCARVSLST
jgi:membrane-anchored protein YejM (alkaline phosphatase superfamily)